MTLRYIGGIAVVLLAALALQGCGTAPAGGKQAAPGGGKAASSAASTAYPSPQAQAKLGDIQNYSFVYNLTSAVISGSFYSPQNYQVTFGKSAGSGVPQRRVNGVTYVELGTTWTKSTGTMQSPLGQVATQMNDLLKVSGLKVKPLGGCTVAGRPGKSYELSVSGGGVGGYFQICIDDATGGLLESQQKFENQTGSGPASMGDTFKVTQVGGVKPFPVPN